MRRLVLKNLSEVKFTDALAAIWAAIAFGDHYVNEKKIWEIKDAKERRQTLFNLISLLEAVAVALVPFMPDAATKIKNAFTHEGDGLKVKKIESLFPRLK